MFTMNKPRLLIDANTAVLRRGYSYLSGIGRTTLELIQALSEKDQLPFSLQLYYQNLKGDTSALDQLAFDRLRLPLPGAKTYKDLVTRMRVKEIISNYKFFIFPITMIWWPVLKRHC